MIAKNINDSIILVDKSGGKTSFQTIREAKKLLGVKKIGHSGILDKFASGLLVVCTGYATKLTRYFLEDEKRYTGIIKLGISTDTLDKEGTVTGEKPTDNLDVEAVKSAVSKFIGEISQIPPQYSALKIDGKRASDLMRAGKRVNLKERKVTIYSLDIVHIDLHNAEITVDVRCTKGTYIRSLARDIGNALGTGAHLSSLRRTESGIFNIKKAANLNEIKNFMNDSIVKKSFILKPADALYNYSRITVRNGVRKKILNGVYFESDDIVKKDFLKKEIFCIIDENENLLAMANIDFDIWNIKYLNVFNQNEQKIY